MSHKVELNAVLVAHATEIIGPPQKLAKFLLKTNIFNKILIIFHPLVEYTQTTYSFIIYINKDKRKVKKIRIPTRVTSNTITYLIQTITTIFVALLQTNLYHIGIGADALNSLALIPLKLPLKPKLGIIFYAIDFTPKRFSSRILNHVYIILNTLAARIADVVWGISPRMVNMFKSITESEKNLVVEVGVPLDMYREIKERTSLEVPRKVNMLVCITHITREKGIEELVKAISYVRRHIPTIRLIVIGDGPYKPYIKSLVKKLHLENNVELLGKMNYKEALNKATECDIGIAPYMPDPRSIAYFADPTKLKEYICCNLPVLTTPVTWFACEVLRHNLGIITQYDARSLARSIISMLKNRDKIEKMRKNAARYSTRLIQERIYLSALNATLNFIKNKKIFKNNHFLHS